MIPLMICYARSGGTLLNRCIGSLPGVIMLSEVNPAGGGSGRGPVSYKTPWEQAKHWYGIEIDGRTYRSSIVELSRKAELMGKKLVVRDWTFVNFGRCNENGYDPPGRFMALSELGSQAKPFAFVRDAIDVYLSYGHDLDNFFADYRTYAEALVKAGIRVFRYEDFCRDPDGTLKKICDHIGLEFSRDYLDFMKFNKINGDIQSHKPSRGIRLGHISPLPRKNIKRSISLRIDRNSDMAAANRILGYPVTYRSRKRESLFRIKMSRIAAKAANAKSRLFGGKR